MDPTRGVSPHERRTHAVSVLVIIAWYQLYVGWCDDNAILVGVQRIAMKPHDCAHLVQHCVAQRRDLL